MQFSGALWALGFTSRISPHSLHWLGGKSQKRRKSFYMKGFMEFCRSLCGVYL